METTTRTPIASPSPAGPGSAPNAAFAAGAFLPDRRRVPRRGQRGATTIAIAGGLAAAIAFTALVIDTGQVLVTQQELQNVADFAAKSAASELSRVYMTAGRQDPVGDTLSTAEVSRLASAADARARKNTAGKVPISVLAADVVPGRWNSASANFAATAVGVDSVRVTARRDTTANGVVGLLMPGFLGRATMPLEATATARLSGIRYLPAGMADFPVAIAKAWYALHASPCSQDNTITLYPTGTADSCAGWHTFQTEPASAASLKSILNGLRLKTWTSPAIDVSNTEFIFNGGTVSSAFNDLVDLYDARKNAAGEMRVLIPVYDRDDCGNPNGWIPIVGVARAVVTSVQSGSGKKIVARVECDVVKPAASGGTDFGVLAAGPDLVR